MREFFNAKFVISIIPVSYYYNESYKPLYSKIITKRFLFGNNIEVKPVIYIFNTEDKLKNN